MPSLTPKQYRAMAAAKSGHSTLGIPASVGAEFVAATPPEKRKAWAKSPAKARKAFEK